MQGKECQRHLLPFVSRCVYFDLLENLWTDKCPFNQILTAELSRLLAILLRQFLPQRWNNCSCVCYVRYVKLCSYMLLDLYFLISYTRLSRWRSLSDGSSTGLFVELSSALSVAVQPRGHDSLVLSLLDPTVRWPSMRAQAKCRCAIYAQVLQSLETAVKSDRIMHTYSARSGCRDDR